MTPSGLSLSEVKRLLAEEASVVERWLADCVKNDKAPKGLLAAMEYSLMAGGKRIRPVLCLISYRLFAPAADVSAVLPFAGALECIHTYSLIHDDLPAMDDDDLRRGKASCHKQFDEATAILAGDALLTDAFTFMTSIASLPPERLLRAVALVAEAAGSAGMVGGQFLDLRYTNTENVSLASLAAMHAMKTGALLRAPCISGALLAGADKAALAAMASYGEAIGAAFQIADDILDEVGTEEELGKPVGSDAALNKSTYPSLIGIEASRRLAEDHSRDAINALAPFAGRDADLLRGLAAYIVNRVS